MKIIAKRAKYLVIVLCVFVFCFLVFLHDYQTSALKWVNHPSNRNIYSNGELAISSTVHSSDGVLLLQSGKNGLTYAEDSVVRKSTLHAVGDRDENILTGVLKSQKKDMIGYNLVDGVYNAKNKTHEVNLTVNAELSSIAYQALNGYKGTVGIYDYKTGEVLCMVSTPTFDPNKKIDPTSDAYDGVYVNRLTNGLFVPGSTMKLATSLAAINEIDDIYSQKFTCNKGTTVNGEWISCTGNHGTIDFEKALAVSCNAAFAQISNQLGQGTIDKYVEEAGLTSSYQLNGVTTTKGKFSTEGVSNVELAWAGIGQSTTLINPFSELMYMGAIANEGNVTTPYYIKNNNLDVFSKSKELISTSNANELKYLMRNNTKVTYGDSNFPGLDLCAKTGTAEVESGNPHSWFVGFSDNPDTPFAFVILVENGANTNTKAINVAKKVLNKVDVAY